MKRTLDKFAPTAVLLAALLYCVWPFLGDGTNRWTDAGTPKTPEIAQATLSPPKSPTPQRDPFRLLAMESPSNSSGDITANTDASEQFTSDETEMEDAVEGEPTPPALVLNATYVRDDYRAALINGHLVGIGDAINDSGNSPGPIVEDIQPHKVVLAFRGQRIELEYSPNSPAAPRSAPPVTASSRSGRPAISPQRQPAPHGTTEHAVPPTGDMP